MYYHVLDAKYIDDYLVDIKFKDNTEGNIDFQNEFDGPIFEPLRNIHYFKKFDIQGKTMHWENGADFAPEYLYKLIKSKEKTGAVTK